MKTMANWTSFMPESEIRRLLKVSVPYYFGGGKPGLLPYQTFIDIFRELADDYQNQVDQNKTKEINSDLNYGVTLGDVELRQVFSRRFKRVDKVDVPPENVAISSGSQQILYGIIDCLCDPGDIIITTRPTYLGFLGCAVKLGTNVITIDGDLQGIKTDELEKCLEILDKEGKIGRVKLLYVVPEADNPGGTTIPWDRRQKIFDLAEKYDFMILEDTAYREICWNKPPDPIKTLDKDNTRVIYARTTSKECASIRLGYSAMPTDVIDVFGKLKGNLDLCTPSLTQKIARVYYEKYIDDAIPAITKAYQKRGEVMTRTMDETFPAGSRTTPDGGFFIWWESEKKFNAADFLERVAIPHDVLYVPGGAFYPLRGQAFINDNGGMITNNIILNNTMRLSFSFTDEDIIRRGISILGQTLTNELA